MAQVIMVVGTTAGAGKSFFCTALCRFLADLGLRAAPFTGLGRAERAVLLPEGLLLDRDVVLAAEAARTSPLAAMNPLLVREEDGIPVLTGSGGTKLPAGSEAALAEAAFAAMLSAMEELQAEYDVIVTGGYGNPTDTYRFGAGFANLGLAAAVKAPVVLVAGIDRGGVYASVAGTLELLPVQDRERVRGLVINRFRGDMKLLQPGLALLSQITGKTVLGVLPYVHGLDLPKADGALPGRSAREEYYRRLAALLAQYLDIGLLQEMLRGK